MAQTGTVIYTSGGTGTRTIYPTGAYTLFSMVLESGSWPSLKYKITSVSIQYTIQTKKTDEFSVLAEFADGTVDTITGSNCPTQPEGAHTCALKTGYAYAGLKSIRLKSVGGMNASLTLPVKVLVNWEIDQIVSDFTLSSAAVDAGGSVTLTAEPYSSSYSHSWRVTFGSHVLTGSMAAGVTAASISIPVGWLDAIPSAASGVATVELSTADSSGVFGSKTKALTITVPDSAAPSIGTCSVAPLLTVGGVTFPAVVAGGYVQGKCGYRATISGAAGKYGATIKAYSIQGGGYSGTEAALSSGLLTQTGTVTVSFKVVDSRGKAASKQVNITVLAYAAPAVKELSAWRVNADGTADPMGTAGKWAYSSGFSALGGANSCTMTAFLKGKTGAETALGWLDGENGASWLVDSAGEELVLSLTEVYTLRVVLTDAYGSTESRTELPSADFAMHFNAAGNAVCFGGACTREHAVEIVKERGLWLGEHRVGAAARNLLDNSDFANPVNQRGITGKVTPNGTYAYTIDRWKVATTGTSSDVYINVAAGYYVSIAPPSASSVGEKYTELVQNFENYSKMKGKTYTLLVKFRYLGEYYEVAKTFVMGDAASPVYLIPGKTAVRLNSVDGANIILRICADDGGGADYEVAFYYAALYEGAYTEKNVPPYVPKGYAVELAECQRYFERVQDHIYFSAAGVVNYIIHYSNKRIWPTIALGKTLYMSAITVAFEAWNATVNDAGGRIGTATGNGYWYGYFDVSADL